MAIDKKIDYVEQDGSLNYIKDSESVTVPKKFKARKNAPATKLAYITDAEAKMLKKQKPGTPHKGPKGIPSYDSFDAQGNYTSGTAMSAAETGSSNERDRREVGASNLGAPKGPDLPPGVDRKPTQKEKDLRAAFIAAGGGQRVNPGFFDSRDRISPAELARARALNSAAFKAGRRGGIMDFFTGGGFLGNLIRGIGQRFGLGKRFNEPTYDMRQFSGINPTFQNDLGNEGLLSLLENEEDVLTNTTLRRNPNDDYLGPNLNEGIFMDYQELDESGIGFKPRFGGTVLEDEFSSTKIPDMRDLGNPYADSRIVPEEFGLEPGPTPFTFDDRRREEGPKLGIGSDFDKDIEDYLSQAGNQGIMQLAEVKPNTLKQLKRMGIFKEGQKSPYTDKDEIKMMVPGLQNATDEELDQILAGTFRV